MDFRPNKEQEMLKQSARDFLKTQCDSAILREIEAGDKKKLKKLWKEAAKLDWMGILIPEDYEGVGYGIMDQAILCEEFGRAAMPAPVIPNIMGTLLLLGGGSEQQKEIMLPDVAIGKRILTTAIDEEGVFYDPKFCSLKAEKTESGYRLKGTKLFVSHAEFATHLIVVARTSGSPGDEQGLTLFIVDTRSKEIELSPMQTIAGDLQYQIDFNDTLVSQDDVIGDVDSGYRLTMEMLSKAAALQCIEMTGGAQKELEMTAEYLKTRIQFGKPLGSFQAVQHKLADMYIDVQGARWVSYQAIWKIGEGLDATREVSTAKIFANKAAQRVAFSAQQLHGGMGVDMDYDLQIYYRRAKVFELRLGTSDYHLERLEQVLEL